MTEIKGFKMSKQLLAIHLIIVLLIAFSYYFILTRGIIIGEEDIPLGDAGMTATELKMIPNDINEARNNANKMITAMNDGFKVIIDGTYYMTTPSVVLGSDYVSISGINGGELLFDNTRSVVMFDTAKIKTFIMDGVSIKNLSATNSLLFVYSSALLATNVELIDVNNCTFDGNISLIRYKGDYNRNPNEYGIKQFAFRNNVVRNTRLSFIILTDVITFTEMTSNRIENFDLIFFNNGTTNGEPYYAVLGTSGFARVTGNTVINDDTWWSNADSGLYLCFFLFEGNQIIYEGNHVEGLKSAKKTAIYDTYLSVTSVTYTNNTWKNNIGFYALKDPMHNALIKSKGGQAATLTRVYTGNTYTVEESYAERMGMPKEYLTVGFLDFDKTASYYEVSNNVFDVYSVVFSPTSMDIYNFVFVNNRFTSKIATGPLMFFKMTEGVSDRTCTITGNAIEFQIQDPKYSLMLLKGINYGTVVNKLAKLTIASNSIIAPFRYVFYDVKATTVDFKSITTSRTSNVIKVQPDLYKGVGYRTDTIITSSTLLKVINK